MCSFASASVIAVCPFSVFIRGSAPASRSRATTSWWPITAAWCNAVRPFSSCRSTSGAASSHLLRRLTTSLYPLYASKCRQLCPLWFRCKTSARASSNAFMASSLEAKKRGVCPKRSTMLAFALWRSSSCNTRASPINEAVCNGLTNFSSCWLTSAPYCKSNLQRCKCWFFTANCSGQSPVSDALLGSALASRRTLTRSNSSI
mmetsp:Transcript_65187/g.121516  ORF Transcript_65187/g.121516 Transcript_65187/m.121516 type:complete len:203 (-) Transcript_65187:205-813(-)